MKAGLIMSAILMASSLGAVQAQSQMEMNNQARDELEKADRKLNRAYASLMGKLTPDAKDKLRKAQLTWISFRDQECEFETLKTVGGSIHGMLLAYCQARLSEQRAADFERMLADCKQEGNLSCPPMAN